MEGSRDDGVAEVDSRSSRRPLRIAFVITELEIGGAEKALVELVTRLNRQEWAPSVIALGGEGALVGPLRSAGIPTVCLGLKSRQVARGMVRLRDVLARLEPVLIQTFLFHANLLTRVVAKTLSPRPCLVAGLRVAEREKGWHNLLDRLTVPGLDAAVCVSEGVRQFALQRLGIEERRLFVIPNSIDCRAIEPIVPRTRVELGLPDEAQIVLFVGRLHRQKGVDLLLQAWQATAARVPHAWLVLAGDGPDGEQLRRQSVGLAEPLRNRIVWLRARRDVIALMKAADLLVLPSRWEGMPNVILEAMACSLPVIATSVEGSSELVVPGETGWLIPPGDSLALAAVLLESLADPSIRREFGRNGRKRAESLYSPARTTEAYERLWSRLLTPHEEITKSGSKS